MKDWRLSKEYLRLFSVPTRKSVRSKRVLPRYLDWLTAGVPLEGRVVYDIGGGTGLFSFYAAERGANRVICVEPLGDGSCHDMLSKFETARHRVRNGRRVDLDMSTLSEFAASVEDKSDVVILHNVINHLDERACRYLHVGEEAAILSYIEKFRALNSLLENGGWLIVADAGRKSFWNWVGMRDPFAPTVERAIHQEPETWLSLLKAAGFVDAKIKWTPYLSLMTMLPLGGPQKKRPLMSYIMLGHFVLTMRKKT